MRKPKDFVYPSGLGENVISTEDFNLTQARRLLAYAERLVDYRLALKSNPKPAKRAPTRRIFAPTAKH